MPSNKFLIISIFAAAFAISTLIYVIYASNNSQKIEASDSQVAEYISKEKLIKVDESGFVPSKITIRAYDQVQWKNTGTKTHRITFRLASSYYNLTNLDEEIKNGESVNFTFERPGKYNYYDFIHPQFGGEVTVE